MIHEIAQELRAFFTTILDWMLLFVLFSLFFFVCNVVPVEFLDRELPLPVPNETSFASDIFTHLVADLVPPNIPLVVTDPMTAFVAQFKIALLLSFIFTLPVFLLRVVSYLSPALHPHERRFLISLLLSLTTLFLAGVWFAYSYVIGPVFSILYGFATPIHATALLGVGEFIGITLALLLFTGLSFTLPVGMVLLSKVGLISGRYWLQHTRIAAVIFLVISAIITPDGSGVSMLILTAPITALYVCGSLVAIGVTARVPQQGRKGGIAVSSHH